MDLLAVMRAFVAVADAGQFSLASERLGLSRAMASKQVMDLEAHLGLRLLNRTTRRVSLTDEGAGYLERCRDILAGIEEEEQEFTARSLEPSGRLRVTAPMSFGASHVARQLALFAARNPRVSVELTLNDRHVDLVEEGFDLAIRIGRLADSSLVAKKVGEMRLIACAAPTHLATRDRWPRRYCAAGFHRRRTSRNGRVGARASEPCNGADRNLRHPHEPPVCSPENQELHRPALGRLRGN